MEFLQITAPHPEIETLLQRHADLMRSLSAEESCHVMTGNELRAEGAKVFGLFDQGIAVAVGALKPLPPPPQAPASFLRVELKSMHVGDNSRGQGMGQKMLRHLLDVAATSGAESIWLETDADPAFVPARRLYESSGFTYCPPFDAYMEDTESVFMMRILDDANSG